MSPEMTSILIGTAGLTFAALVALLLAFTRRGVSSGDIAQIRTWAGLAVLLHVGHFMEEYYSAFYIRFPQLLGLSPWPASFFIGANVAWLVVWLMALALLHRFPRAAIFPLWFLGIAATVNGVAHPALAIGRGGYFPGFWSSSLIGGVGVYLLCRLMLATAARHAGQG